MFHQLLLPFVFSPLSAAAQNVSKFRVVLGAEFLLLYHSAVAKASSATASIIWAVLTAVVSQIHTFLISDTTPGSITFQYSCMLYVP